MLIAATNEPWSIDIAFRGEREDLEIQYSYHHQTIIQEKYIKNAVTRKTNR